MDKTQTQEREDEREKFFRQMITFSKPETAINAEIYHKEVSKLTPNDLLQTFSI